MTGGTHAGYGNAVIYNAGEWQIAVNGTLSSVNTNVFINAGTLDKISSSTTTIGWSFTNLATVESHAGTLSLQGGVRQTSGQTILSGGNLNVNPSFQLDGGVLAGSNTVTGPVTNNSIVK